MFSWFCPFHSASVAGGHSSSHEIPPVHYSFEHNSIPSPAYTTICSAVPQLKGTPLFSILLTLQRVQLKYFCTSLFSYDLFGGTNAPMVRLDQKASTILVIFVHSTKLLSRMLGLFENFTSNALMTQFHQLHYSP